MTRQPQISTTISPETRRKLDELVQHYGTQRETVTIAIDRLYREEEEKKTMKHSLSIPDDAGKTLSSWIAICTCGAHWRCEYDRSGLNWKRLNAEAEICPCDPANRVDQITIDD